MEDTMLSLTRTMLPTFALVAMMAAAQAQTTDQDHTSHHPDGTGAAQLQEVPVTGQAGNAPTTGQGMGSGMVVQPGTQPPRGQTGMMGDMGMMGNMGPMMPMMRQMMMNRQDGMSMPFEHVEGRIAFLKAELRITDAQKPQWDAFANTLRENARTHQSMHEQMTKGGMPSSWPERLAFQQKALSARLNSLNDLEAAAKPLYASLTEEQRKIADQLLSGPMGMM
jgi:hypothetical protein